MYRIDIFSTSKSKTLVIQYFFKLGPVKFSHLRSLPTLIARPVLVITAQTKVGSLI